MTLYFENPVVFPESGSISVNGKWHPNAPLLAISSFSQEKGGFVIIFDEQGEAIQDVNFPVHRSYQVTSLAWHPEKKILATGWENGELKLWSGVEKEFANVSATHVGSIILVEFSEKGGRMVSCDSSGSILGWKIDQKGQANTAFHLDLKEQITHLTFRLTVKSHYDYDVEGLAKAAVAGDENALDMFSNWRPKTTARRFRVHDGSDHMSFFIAAQVGAIFYINNSGSCSEVLNTEGVPLSYIVYHQTKDALIVMMEGLTIGYFGVDVQGHLTELMKVKLSGRVQTRTVGNQGLIWCSSSALAILTGDLNVRIWDIESNDNYVLPTSLKLYINDSNKAESVNEIFTCLAYSSMNQTLCAGTNVGRLFFWTKAKTIDPENPEENWELNNIATISGTVKQIMWCSSLLRTPLLGVNCVTSVFIMKEQTISVFCSEKIWGTQKTASQILLESKNGNYLLKLENEVTDMVATDKLLVFTNGRVITVYELTWKPIDNSHDINSKLSREPNDCDFTLKHYTSFNCENEKIAIYEKLIIALKNNAVIIRSYNATNIITINSNSVEGEPIGIDVTGCYLTIFTIEGFLKVYDLTYCDPKLFVPAKSILEMVNDFGEIIEAKTNSSGNKVALLIAGTNLFPDGNLYIWDIENDNLMTYHFAKTKFGKIYSEHDENLENLNETSSNYDEILADRLPLSVQWDKEDGRLLVCNAKKIKSKNTKKELKIERSISNVGEQKTLKDEENVIITIFVSSEHGIKIHDVKAIDLESRLLLTSTPYIVTLQKLRVVKDLMSDFNELEECDKSIKTAVLDFSYNLTLGNMDEAFKAIKLVQSKGVWVSLAKMCVKTKRMDVAIICLSHMGDAKAVRALKLAMADETLPFEAKIAVLAVQLGMLDEAEQLYTECNRYDLLNKLLRSRNKLDAAIAIAESKDRIHLRNTEHAWAQMLEQNSEFKEACAKYEKANTHKHDVPRMLIDRPQLLKNYMTSSKDNELIRWWGQYTESQGDMVKALKIYATAGDVYSQVRVLCFIGQEEKAATICRNSTDKAAFYQMARYYESLGKFEESVNYFTKATAYGNAVRLAKENNMSEDLWNLRFLISNRDSLECAKYFEEANDIGKAVVLYHRAGKLHKALDLAFSGQLFDNVQQITSDLDTNSDPVLVQKCAEYFIDNDKIDKAVDLLAIAKKYNEAITLCLNRNIQISEDLAEKLTPDKDEVAEEMRKNILENLGKSLLVQGDYHLATKKFTQAGDRVQAMKALLKSGDTEKIIFFAGVSRHREIYIMAANYLQSLDWQNSPEILKNIITFYSKGKALDLLANFYVSCAQVEIDEFQNYEKAIGALTEASRCLAKSPQKDAITHQRATEKIQQKITSVKKFIDIRKLFERGDVQAGITQSKLLLMSYQEFDSSVRLGDIYALMITNSVKSGNLMEAKLLTSDLKKYLDVNGKIPLTHYLEKETLNTLGIQVEVPMSDFMPMGGNNDDNSNTDDEIKEDVDEVE